MTLSTGGCFSKSRWKSDCHNTKASLVTCRPIVDIENPPSLLSSPSFPPAASKFGVTEIGPSWISSWDDGSRNPSRARIRAKSEAANDVRGALGSGDEGAPLLLAWLDLGLLLTLRFFRGDLIKES